MAQRQLVYIGRSQRDLQAFPEEVQEVVAGYKHPDALPLKGFHGAGVLEIRQAFRSDAYRVVYTTRMPGAICVLHAFKKTSRQGRETPKSDIDLIRQRLRVATELHAQGDLP